MTIADYGDSWAKRYDELYPSGPDTDAAVDHLAELTGNGRALELGVGTGRVAVPLAQRGCRVAGMDASDQMLGVLAAKPGGERVQTWVGDMRTASWQPCFDLVYIVGSTLFGATSVEDQTGVLRAAAAGLTPAGRVLVECFVPMDPNADPVIRTERVVDGEALQIHLRWLTPQKLVDMAHGVGLAVEAIAGDWSASPLTAASGRVVATFRSLR